MPDTVDLLVEDDRWKALPLAQLAEDAVGVALRCVGLAPSGFELTVLACSDHRIALLNEEFRGKGKPTNVLSWPSEERGANKAGARPETPAPGNPDEPNGLGDIAIAWETVEREAGEGNIAIADHVAHLLVHATLHLLGFDHEDDADADLMEGLEAKALALLGLSDPYEKAS